MSNIHALLIHSYVDDTHTGYDIRGLPWLSVFIGGTKGMRVYEIMNINMDKFGLHIQDNMKKIFKQLNVTPVFVKAGRKT